MTEPSNVYNNLRSGTDYHLPATPSEAASDTDEELLTEHNIPSAMAQAVVTNVPLRPFDSHTDVPNLFIKNFEAWCLSRKTEGDMLFNSSGCDLDIVANERASTTMRGSLFALSSL